MIFNITRRYKYDLKSVELYDEIKNSIKLIAPILQSDCERALCFLYQTPTEINVKETKEMLEIVYFGMKTFYNLNFQVLIIYYFNFCKDLPEYFEDNMKTWIIIIKGVLELQDINFKSKSSSKLLRLYINSKCKALKCLNLYCSEYNEELQPYIIWLSESVNKLVFEMNVNDDDYFSLNKMILNFFYNIFEKKRNFNFDGVFLDNLLHNVIRPNLSPTVKELDDFIDNPDLYLKTELEDIEPESSKILQFIFR